MEQQSQSKPSISQMAVEGDRLPEQRVEGDNGVGSEQEQGVIIPESQPTSQVNEGSSKQEGENIQVYGPSTNTQSSSTDEGFFEPTLNDVQAHHKSVLARSARLNQAPLLTSKYRELEQTEKEKKKADKWPNTTIRVRFSDGTVVQSVFPSNSPIQPVYEFVRTTLDPSVSSKPFLLWQPPKSHYPEHPTAESKKSKPNHKASIIPPANYGPIKGAQAAGLQSGTGNKETLTELGLVPQSVLLIKFTGAGDEDLNSSGYPAPLKEELREKKVPLPPTQVKESGNGESTAAPKTEVKTEKKIPKWLQKGLLKKK